jgi:hypothetical protein
LSPSDEYKSRLRAHEDQIQHLDRLANLIGNARLILGAAIAIAAGFALLKSAFSPLWLSIPICVFIYLIARHTTIDRRMRRAQRAAALYRNGLARIEDRWVGANQHDERFADPHHIYAADLDLFGKGSLFELLCTARTRMGEDTLADWLLKPATTDVIRGRQIAVTELRAQLDLREDFAILGEQSTVGVQPDALLSWINAESRLQQRWIGWAARLLAVSAVIAAIVWFVSGSVSSLLVVLVIETCVAYALRRQFQRTIVAQETTFANLELLSGFLERLERAQFHSPLARHLVQALASHGLKASRAIAKLRTIVQIIESRRNMFVAALDVPLMISIQAAVAAEAWRRTHGHAVESWLRIVGEFEALLSLAAYSYEHPEDPFPEFVADAAAFRAVGIMHPLIPRLNVVANDVDIDGRARIWLVSGSNMSGKSTLLRTVGINVVLAMAGAPVRAQRLEMTALQVGASIRVNDSLQEGSSRFYAEITRLRQLFETAGSKTPLLVLLDELLQGTNSADRLVGARGVVRALLDRGAIGLVSTHDLALTDIGTANDERIVNVHFQDDMDGDKMKFDYKLRAGVVTKSNALELMRSIGLDV